MGAVGILTGVTASGKTELALGLAQALKPTDLEIINADSLLVYRGLDTGTAKPSKAEQAAVPHWLIDVREPDQPFTAGDFVREAQAAIDAIHARGARALIVGGTGFYLKALIYGLWDAPPADAEIRAKLNDLSVAELYDRLERVDAESARRIGGADRYRLTRALEIHAQTGETASALRARENRAADPRFRLWAIDRPDDELAARISARTRGMLAGDAGLLAETRGLLSRYPGSRCLQAVGYAQASRYLEGAAPPGRRPTRSLEDLAREIDLGTRQLVKAQRTWFRKEPAAQAFLLDRDREKLWQEMLSLYGQSR